MKREKTEIKVNEICEIRPGVDVTAEMVESVRTLGVIRPVVCRRVGDSVEVLSGVKRVAAARAVGLERVHAVVYSGITDEQAAEIRHVENAAADFADPVRAAGLIASMIRLGYDQREIAGVFDVSEAFVCRRAKLIGLVPQIRELALKFRFSKDSVERISSFPAEVQARCSSFAASVAAACSRSGRMVAWRNLADRFACETMSLEQASFDVGECASCFHRTGIQPLLFGGQEDSLGRCLNHECYLAKLKNKNRRVK